MQEEAQAKLVCGSMRNEAWNIGVHSDGRTEPLLNPTMHLQQLMPLFLDLTTVGGAGGSAS